LITVCLLAASQAASLGASLGAARQEDAATKEEALLSAARKGDVATVKSLVEGGVPVDCKNRYGITPLYYAAWGGSEEVARYLIGRGADVNVRDTFYKMNALVTAISKKNEGVARALVEAGAVGAESVLGMAAANGQAALVATILEKTKPNEAQLRNAVQTAQDKGDAAMVAMLRKAGAPEPRVLGVKIAEDKLARLAGVFAGQGVGEATVEITAGKLMLKTMGGANELLAYDELNFASPGMPGMKFEFVLEGERAKSLKVSGNGTNAVLNRVEGK
jgi:ankyrin repeat protein